MVMFHIEVTLPQGKSMIILTRQPWRRPKALMSLQCCHFGGKIGGPWGNSRGETPGTEWQPDVCTKKLSKNLVASIMFHIIFSIMYMI